MAYKGRFNIRNPSKYKGDPQRIIYRSLWERKFMVYCDTNDAILEWGSEEIIIPYLSPIDGRIHRYFPDFYIKVRQHDGSIEKSIVEIKPSHNYYDYECKYTEGMSTYDCPAKLPSKLTKEIQQTAKTIFQILGCKNYGRIDFLLDTDEESWFLEVNTLPGMTKTSLVPKAFKAAGGSFEELIKKIIEETEKNIPNKWLENN